MFRLFSTIVFSFIISMLIVTTYYVQDSRSDNMKAKQALVLSAKSLKENYSVSVDKYLLDSFDLEVEVDKEELIKDFEELLYLNTLDHKTYDSIRSNLNVKALVYEDRFYIAGLNNVWSVPIYFSYVDDSNELVYFNTVDALVKTFDVNGVMVESVLSDWGITNEEKDQYIIDKINAYIGVYTMYLNRGLQIKIRNENNLEIDYKTEMASFNVLEGVTFFVIYKRAEEIVLIDSLLNLNGSEIVGYTVK